MAAAATIGTNFIKLKIRSPIGDQIITNLTKNSTLADLFKILQEKTSIPILQQELRTTYPPPGRLLIGELSTLADLKIQSNDLLILKKLETILPQPAAASSYKPSSSPIPASLESLLHLRPLTVHPIPNDNSCLFNAVGGLIEGFNACGQQLVTELRQTVASVIQQNQDDKYSDAVLGDISKEKYVENILKENTWGGGIELAILADIHDIEIASFDVETCHLYLFGQQDDIKKQRSRRIYLVYYGVHYDALYDINSNGTFQRIFSPNDEIIYQRALLTVRQLQRDGNFTNLSKFSLKCSNCSQGFVGAVEAQEHAKNTGHFGFEEYKQLA